SPRLSVVFLTAVQADDEESASPGTFALDVAHARESVIDRGNQDTLKLARKQALNQPLVLRLNLDKVRESTQRIQSRALLARKHLLHGIRVVRVMRVQIFQGGEPVSRGVPFGVDRFKLRAQL